MGLIFLQETDGIKSGINSWFDILRLSRPVKDEYSIKVEFSVKKQVSCKKFAA
jgi:hypothetical protein